MRIKLKLASDNHVVLPIHYNHLVQSLIYSNLDEKLSRFLHDKGFCDGKRNFKGFTFSRLMSKKRKVLTGAGKISLLPPLELVVSSPLSQFVEGLAETLIKQKTLDLGNNKVYFESISFIAKPKLEGKLRIKMLSPVTVYSTLNKANGKRKTYYYTPMEKEFGELIENNLLKKYRAYYGKSVSNNNSRVFNIEPVRVSKKDEKIILYKGTVIKGWMGVYDVEGAPELIGLAYEAGIGSKNSQGFGCFEIKSLLQHKE